LDFFIKVIFSSGLVSSYFLMRPAET